MTASASASPSENLPEFENWQPLSTDALIEQRVTSLVGRAIRRQLWVLFLDADSLQLRDILAIDDLPSMPTSTGSSEFANALRDMADVAGATSIVLVWERFGSANLTTRDKAWALSLHEACGAVTLPIRAMLLSHRGGVRWVAHDDYLFEHPSITAVE